jgi:hypothetical protein
MSGGGMGAGVYRGRRAVFAGIPSLPAIPPGGARSVDADQMPLTPANLLLALARMTLMIGPSASTRLSAYHTAGYARDP